MSKSDKILYILRHAKAENGDVAQDDHARGLVARGIEAAHAVGEYLGQRESYPERALCSTAKRARQTWDHVLKSYKRDTPTDYSDKLYLASANETLKLISSTPESAKSLIVIGHNPGFHQLAVKLARDGEERALDDLSLKFPTCALAIVSFAGAWADAVFARGTLEAFITPKMLGKTDE